MDMVERVARAICKQEYGDENAGWNNHIPAAIAAIEAMRGPTYKMVKAAREWRWLDQTAGNTIAQYEAMIDSILKSTRETAPAQPVEEK